VKLYLILHF
jgi:hypothetical protein